VGSTRLVVAVVWSVECVGSDVMTLPCLAAGGCNIDESAEGQLSMLLEHNNERFHPVNEGKSKAGFWGTPSGEVIVSTTTSLWRQIDRWVNEGGATGREGVVEKGCGNLVTPSRRERSAGSGQGA